MKPGVQYPHCTAPCLINASCTGWSFSLTPNPSPSGRGEASPSIVTISAPCARGAGTRQAITALPSRNTVQAPHSPSAQPSFVPIIPTSSRRNLSSVFSCPVVIEYSLPLIIVLIDDKDLVSSSFILPLSAFSFLPHNITASIGIPA